MYCLVLVVNRAQNVRQLWLEVNCKVLFKGLKFANQKHYQVKPRMFQRKEKRVLMVKSTFFRRINNAFLASGLVWDVIFRCPVVWIMDVRGYGHMNIVFWVLQRVTYRIYIYLPSLIHYHKVQKFKFLG